MAPPEIVIEAVLETDTEIWAESGSGEEVDHVKDTGEGVERETTGVRLEIYMFSVKLPY